LVVALVAIAVLLGLYGLLVSSQATMGAALVMAACLIGVVARIVQAHQHQTRLMKQLAQSRGRDNELLEAVKSLRPSEPIAPAQTPREERGAGEPSLRPEVPAGDTHLILVSDVPLYEGQGYKLISQEGPTAVVSRS
jgi:hypothetical protein